MPRWSYARRAGESERDTASCVIRDRIHRAIGAITRSERCFVGTAVVPGDSITDRSDCIRGTIDRGGRRC